MFSLQKIAMAGTAAAALMIAGTTPTLAQQANTEATAQATAEAKPVTDAEIEQFVDATIEIQAIIEQWQPKLQEAQGTENAQAVQKQMQDKLVAAVEDEGMSAERYNQINMMASNDPALAQRITAVIENS